MDEISRQPAVWKSIYNKIRKREEEIKVFLGELDKDTRVIFTGAGSSGFIGDSLAPIIRKESKFKYVESIHTTDIVANPDKYLVKDADTLLISFARSGNSPESLAAVQIAEGYIGSLHQIIITCNPKGKLALHSGDGILSLVFDEIDDKGFAMTSSVSGMMLAAYCVLNIEKDLKGEIDELSSFAEDVIENRYKDIFDITDKNIERIVVLGSGNLFGAARESALKTIELSAGKIIAWYDTPMGFRHGPKSMLNEKTLILFFVSDDNYTNKYDSDMLAELYNSNKYKLVAISNKYHSNVEDISDLYIYDKDNRRLGEEFSPYVPILVAQILALFNSIRLGCLPDNPFPSGEVNRVVKGVQIHNF